MTDGSLCWFAVEDKVKDQLEAANPEPIIEEVVSNPHTVVVIHLLLFVCGCCIHLISFPQDLANLAPRKPDW